MVHHEMGVVAMDIGDIVNGHIWRLNRGVFIAVAIDISSVQ